MQLRKSREDHQLMSPCENWEKDARSDMMEEFNLAWDYVDGPLTHSDTCMPSRNTRILEGAYNHQQPQK